MAQVIAALVARSDADHALLQPLGQVALKNWNGLAVGSLRPAPALLALRAR